VIVVLSTTTLLGNMYHFATFFKNYETEPGSY